MHDCRALILIVITSILAPIIGCDDRSSQQDKIRLRFAITADLKSRQLFRQAVAEFHAQHPHIDVELLEIPPDYYQKVMIMIAGRNAPDVMWMGQAFPEFAQRGVLLDLTDRIHRDIHPAEYFPEAMRWYESSGRRYGVAYALDIQIMVYNKAMFDAAHVAHPHDGWGYDEFLSDAKRLTIDKDGDGRPDQYGFCGTLEPCLFGASILSADGSSVTCNTPQMQDFLQTNLDLDEKYKVAPHASQMTNEDFTDLVSVFRQQRFAMMSMFTWNLPYLRDMCRDLSWDIVTNPTIRTSGSWASSQAIVISADTKHPDESWEFVRWMLNRQFEKMIGRSSMPSRRDVAEQMLGRASNSSENDQAILDASQSLHRNPLVPEVSEVIQKWKDACSSVWTLNATPAQAMQRAQHEIERTIAADRRRTD